MNKISSSSYNNNIDFTTNNSSIFTLPKEVFDLILYRLKGPDIVHFAQTCHHVYLPLITHAPLWKSLLQNYFPDSYTNLKSPKEAPSFYKRLRIAVNNVKAWDYSPSWLLGHKNKICCFAVSGNLLVSGSEVDQIIKVWNIKDQRAVHTLCGHKGALTNILIYDNMIISGAADNSIKTWDIASGKLLHTFEGYQGNHNSLVVYNGQLISGQSYGTLKIWDLKSRQRLSALKGSQHQISCIAIWGDQLYSGSFDGTIAIWDLKTGKESTILRTDQSGVVNIVGYNGNLILALLDGTIEIWDFKNSQKQTLRKGDKNTIFNANHTWLHKFLIYDDKLFSLNNGHSNEFWIWDLKSGKELHRIRATAFESGKGMAFSNDKLFFSKGANIQILDFSKKS